MCANLLQTEDPHDRKSAVVTVDDKTVELPVRSGSIGPDVVDIGTLYKQTGQFTYDPGFTSTASCESKITYIDGDQGILLHRGYRSNSSLNTAISSKSATCCFTANCRRQPEEGL